MNESNLGLLLLTQEQSSSEDLGGEASDVLSAISNEECSVASEIFDKPEPGHSLGDILQVNGYVDYVAECNQNLFYFYLLRTWMPATLPTLIRRKRATRRRPCTARV